MTYSHRFRTTRVETSAFTRNNSISCKDGEEDWKSCSFWNMGNGAGEASMTDSGYEKAESWSLQISDSWSQ